LNTAIFLNKTISQSNVVAHLRCGGIFNSHFDTSLLMYIPVKNFLKPINI